MAAGIAGHCLLIAWGRVMDLDTLPRYRFPATGPGREVLWMGDAESRRPVVLLHELAGLASETADYARTLVEAGCVVHMPVIFGTAGQESWVKGAAQLCWGRQLSLILSDRRSKVADWLIELCRHVKERHGRQVVVIGMCATGGVVFSLLGDDAVGAGVSAQPSLPIRFSGSRPNIAALGASVTDVETAASSGKRLLALRYQNDRICPAGRIVQIQTSFPDAGVVELPGKLHSTLVYDPHDDARRGVMELLDEVFGEHD